MPMTPRVAARVLIALVAGGVAAPAAAEFINDLTIRSARTVVSAKAFGELSVSCGDGFKLLAQTVTAHKPDSMITLAQKPILIDGTTPTVAGNYGAPVGASARVFNNGVSEQTLDLQILCNKFDAEYGGTTAAGVINVLPKQYAEGFAGCPPDHVATGGGYETGQLAVLGHYLSYLFPPTLAERADGVHEPPTAWATQTANPGETMQSIRTFAYCFRGGGTTIQANVASLLLKPGERRFIGIQTSGLPYLLGGGMYGGTEAREMSAAVLRSIKAGEATRGFNFTTGPDQAKVAQGGTWGAFVQDGRSTQAAKAAVPTKVAVVVVMGSEQPRPATIVQAVEYYNAARDHYFVTSLVKEIADLDAGVHPGWTRTGEVFNVYAAGSGGPLGRLPVCRFYGIPAAGLDSHFYTASVLECLDVGAKFAGAWEIESGEVFQVLFPNIETGECPAGTIAVMRTWNKRADSNHRYVVKLTLRSDMLAKGHVSEGYGPNGVVFCVPA